MSNLAALFALGQALGGLHRNPAKHFWAEKAAVSVGSRFCIGRRLKCRSLLLGVTGIRAPGEGGDGLLGQIKVGLGVVEDTIGDLEGSGQEG